jgi:hypothetical protein
MGLASILFLAGGIWVCVLGLFMALCRAAKIGDEAMMNATANAPARRRYSRRRSVQPNLQLVAGRTAGISHGRFAGISPGRR